VGELGAIADPKATFEVRVTESDQPPDRSTRAGGLNPSTEKSPTDPRAAVQIAVVRLRPARWVVY
jgi:hypothetical protein